jgi:hypothetical protein
MRRMRGAREKAEQASIVKLYWAFGCAVYDFSQPRATMQTPGIPDLFVFHEESRRSWWHEVKAGAHGLTEPQEEFRRLCMVTHGSDHVWGGYEEALDHLLLLKIATEEEGRLRRNRDFKGE